ncbi:unnamed protein product, partial [Sphagnum troendelagicum]
TPRFRFRVSHCGSWEWEGEEEEEEGEEKVVAFVRMGHIQAKPVRRRAPREEVRPPSRSKLVKKKANKASSKSSKQKPDKTPRRIFKLKSPRIAHWMP